MALGDRFDLLTISQEQADLAGFDAFGTEGAAKQSLSAVLVGVVDGPAALDDPTPVAVLPTSLLDDPDIGVATTIMSVRLRSGTDLDAFRAALDRLPGGDALRLKPSTLVSSEIRTSVEGQALGLWALTAVAAVAALVVLGQLITRQVRLSADEAPSLKALGFSKTQLLAEQVGRAAVPVVTGTVLGTAVATGLSAAFPTGFVRRIEPYPGLRFDAPVLALCGTGLLVALLVWGRGGGCRGHAGRSCTTSIAPDRVGRGPIGQRRLLHRAPVRVHPQPTRQGVDPRDSHGDGGDFRPLGWSLGVRLEPGADRDR